MRLIRANPRRRGEEDKKMIRGIIFPTNGVALRAIPAKWAFIAAVLTKGTTSPAAVPRAGQTAPNSEPANATGPREPANAH